MEKSSETKQLARRTTDLELLKVMVDSLADVLEIYQYLEETPIRDVKVVLNDGDYEFKLEGVFLETAMGGLSKQLQAKAESLKAQIKLS